MSNEISIFHTLIGMFAVMLAVTLSIGPIVTWITVLVLGILHEILDGDLTWRYPYEGVKDALSFLPAPFIYLLICR